MRYSIMKLPDETKRTKKNCPAELLLPLVWSHTRHVRAPSPHYWLLWGCTS